jgi:hypothetical protein
MRRWATGFPHKQKETDDMCAINNDTDKATFVTATGREQLKAKGGEHHEHTPDSVGAGLDGRASRAAGEGKRSDARA